jgi:transposase
MEKKLSVLGLEIAKQVLHFVGMDAHGTMVVRKRLSRAPVMEFIAQLPPTCMGMEACRGAHYWARRFREQGHEVTRMAPQLVTPYRQANKNDLRDAEAMAEAMTRPRVGLDHRVGHLHPFSLSQCSSRRTEGSRRDLD